MDASPRTSEAEEFWWITLIPAPDESETEGFGHMRWFLHPGDIPQLGIAGEVLIAAIPAACTALGVWLGSRNGRKVRLKVGDIEAEAQTQEQLEKLLGRAREIQQEIQQSNQQPKLIP